MADYARWSVACEAFAPGVFIGAFDRAAQDANEVVAENNPVTVAIAAFMMDRNSWSGIAAELLRELSNDDRSEARPSAWNTWPREPISFGKRLRPAIPILRKMGIKVVIGKATNHLRTRTITLSKVELSVHPQQATKAAPSDGSDSSDASNASRTVTKAA